MERLADEQRTRSRFAKEDHRGAPQIPDVSGLAKAGVELKSACG